MAENEWTICGENDWPNLGENPWTSLGENLWTSVARKMTLVAYREGQPCPVCGTAVEKIKTGSTSGFVCPNCQPLG